MAQVREDRISVGHYKHQLTVINWGRVIFFRVSAWMESLYIRALDFKKRPPILIYQMGKVGSTSLYKTLRRAMPLYPIFHIHWFSKKGLVTAEKINLTTKDPVFDLHLKRCKLLRSLFDNGRMGKCKIISLTRDPIAREVSNLFQDTPLFHPHLLNSNGTVRIDKARAEIQKKIEHKTEDVNYCLSWFAEEFNEALHVDIFKYPFNKSKGYQITKHNRYDILIIKLEQLSDCFQNALGEFLGHRIKSNLIIANTSDKKKYSWTKSALQEKLKIDPAMCKSIYSEPYVRHFYTSEEIEGFMHRWRRPIER